MTTTHVQPIEAGDFIRIPTWKVEGQVTSVTGATLGSDNAIEITLQERPEGPERRYRLEPDEYEVID